MSIVLRGTSRAWSTYSRWLGEKPISANIWTSGIIVGVGDYFAQCIEQESFSPTTKNWSRIVLMSGWGFVTGGPMYYWYRFLDKIWPPAGLSIVGVAQKTLGNQVVMAPFMNSLFFAFTVSGESMLAKMGSTTYQEEKSIGEAIKTKLQQDLSSTITTSLFYWIPVQIINFSVVPARYRILYLSMGLWGWSTYLSIVAHRKKQASAPMSSVADTIAWEALNEKA